MLLTNSSSLIECWLGCAGLVSGCTLGFVERQHKLTCFSRFTVQYNLFAGTVLGLGGPEQIAKLKVMQEKGQLD